MFHAIGWILLLVFTAALMIIFLFSFNKGLKWFIGQLPMWEQKLFGKGKYPEFKGQFQYII